jgi:hypothetical protein
LVLNYIQNLIDWGDSLFAQFTHDMISQATLLYNSPTSSLDRSLLVSN